LDYDSEESVHGNLTSVLGKNIMAGKGSRWQRTSWQTGSRDGNIGRSYGKIIALMIPSTVTYFLQLAPPLTFHLLPIMPSYYESIKVLLH
jgi:hypothetical protein